MPTARLLNGGGDGVYDSINFTYLLKNLTDSFLVDEFGNTVVSTLSTNGTITATDVILEYEGEVLDVGYALSNISDITGNLNTRITAIETLDSIQNTRLDNLEAVNVTQNNRLSSIENINSTQNSRLSAIEAVDSTQNSRLANVESKNSTQDTLLSNIDNRLDNIESIIGQITASIETLRGDTSFAFSILEARVDELSDRVTALETSVNQLNTNVTQEFIDLDNELTDLYRLRIKWAAIWDDTMGTFIVLVGPPVYGVTTTTGKINVEIHSTEAWTGTSSNTNYSPFAFVSSPAYSTSVRSVSLQNPGPGNYAYQVEIITSGGGSAPARQNQPFNIVIF
jgi:hypothetical protein